MRDKKIQVSGDRFGVLKVVIHPIQTNTARTTPRNVISFAMAKALFYGTTGKPSQCAPDFLEGGSAGASSGSESHGIRTTEICELWAHFLHHQSRSRACAVVLQIHKIPGSSAKWTKRPRRRCKKTRRCKSPAGRSRRGAPRLQEISGIRSQRRLSIPR
jgi:hypothetical protein